MQARCVDAAARVERLGGSRVLSVVLIAIGFGALLAVMYMTWRTGWSLQEDQGDRWASAVSHVLSDAGAAALISASSYMLCQCGWRWKLAGAMAGLSSVVLICYSIVNVYSFMSTRIARLEAHDKVVEAQRQALNWRQGIVVNKGVPRAERLYLRRETRHAEENLERSLASIPDVPAQSLADLLGTTPLRVQRFLVMAASCVGQIIKLTCLFFGFFLWPHKIRHGAPVGPPQDGDLGVITATSDKATAGGSLATAKPTAITPTAMLTGSAGCMAVSSMEPPQPSRSRGVPLPKAVAEDLVAAAEWFVKGGSPWRSIRALARAFGCHHSTAGDYVQRAEQRSPREGRQHQEGSERRTQHPCRSSRSPARRRDIPANVRDVLDQ